jgi:hypothetical protein
MQNINYKHACNPNQTQINLYENWLLLNETANLFWLRRPDSNERPPAGGYEPKELFLF